MSHFVINFVENNINIFETAGLYVVFFSGLLESIPLFGFIVPGQTIIVLGGLLAKLGVLNLKFTFIAAGLGAIFGDILSFYVGKLWGEKIIQKYGNKIFIKKEYLEKTKKLVHEHLGKTLFVGRFHSFTRALTPFVAGTTKISSKRFLPICILSGSSWAIIFVSLGYIFGKSFDVIAPAIGKFVTIATLITITILVFIHFAKKKDLHFTKKETYLFITNILSVYIFSAIAESIENKGLIISIDEKIRDKIFLIYNPFLTHISLFVESLKVWHFILFSIILSLWLIIQKRYKESAFGLLSLLSAGVAVIIIKASVARARPEGGMLVEKGGSFPSGHAVLSTLFLLTLCYSYIKHTQNKYKKVLFVAINIVMIIFVSFSRIYLGVHWLSDTLSGIAFGVFWFTGTIILSKFIPWLRNKIRTRQILMNL